VRILKAAVLALERVLRSWQILTLFSIIIASPWFKHSKSDTLTAVPAISLASSTDLRSRWSSEFTIIDRRFRPDGTALSTKVSQLNDVGVQGSDAKQTSTFKIVYPT
jgi:hypothetical protein